MVSNNCYSDHWILGSFLFITGRAIASPDTVSSSKHASQIFDFRILFDFYLLIFYFKFYYLILKRFSDKKI